MSALREGSGTRWLALAASAIIVSALAIAAWAMFDLAAGSEGERAFATGDGGGGESVCASPVDISLVFDHTGSMDDVPGKIENAVPAAVGFVNAFAGGPAEPSLSPHDMALVGFNDGVASTDVPLTQDAAALRAQINSYLSDTSGYTHIGRALQLGQLELGGGTDPDYMVLLSDGAANRPKDVDDSGAQNDFYIDINDNGIVDSGDDLSVDFGGGDGPDFVVVDGLWIVNRSLGAPTNTLDVTEDGSLDNSDDYNFDGDVPGATANFEIIDGTLYLDADGNGAFALNPNDPPSFTAGHTDELTVLRNGLVWAGSSTFSGDGSDVYAQYWATQTKSTGTFLYVIGYDLGPEQDSTLLSAMASPGGFIAGGPNDISGIFQDIAQAICGIQVVKQCTAVVREGDPIDVTATVTNPFGVPIENVGVTDTLAGALTFVSGDTNGDTLLDTGETWVYTGSYTAPPGSQSSNTVTASGTAGSVQVQATDDCTTEIIHPAIEVVKQCTELVHEGEPIDVTATVTNPGDVALSNVGVDDTLAGALTLQSGDTNGDTMLDTDETWVFAGSYLAPPGTQSSNTVTAEGTDPLQAIVQDTDDCTTIVLNPDIEVVKQCTGLVYEGDPIDVTATVTNTGDVELHDVVVTDSEAGPLAYVSGDTNGDTKLDMDETWVYTGSYTAPAGTQSSNTVTVTALNTDDFQVQDTDDCTTDIITPVIQVDKDCTGLVHPGDQIDVWAVVTNPGDVALSNVGVDDTLAGALALQSGDTNGDTLLDIDETWLFTGSYTAPAGTQSSNTVTAEGTDPLQATVQDTDDCTTTIINPDIQVVKQCTDLVHPGEQIDVTAMVTNPGDVALADVTVSDDLAGPLTYVSGDTDGDTLLDTNEAWEFTGSYTAPVGSDSSNTVTAEGTDPLDLTVQDTDDCRTDIISAAIQVDKDCTGLVHPGDQIDVWAVVTNLGDVALSNVSVDDTLAGALALKSGDTNGDTLLDIDETWLFTGSYTAPAGTQSSNTVTAEGTDPLQATVQDTDDCTTIIINPDINVVKQCTGLVHPGEPIDVTATVTNPGDVSLADVSVDDSEAGPLTYVSGDTDGDTLLDIDETWVFTGSYTAPAGTQSSNTVTAEGTDPLDLTVQDTDDCTTTIINPDIQVVKQCTGLVHPGEQIGVTATVTNPGDVALSNVSVDDTLAGALDFLSGDTNGNFLLDTDETWVFTRGYTAPAGTQSSNTVTAEGTDPLAATVQDTDDCTTTIINPDIQVVKQCTGLVYEGDPIDVTATVTNPGDVALSNVGVDDTLAGSLTLQSGDTNGDTKLDTDETWVFTGSYTAPAGTQSSNTVTAEGTDPLQATVQDTDDCTTTIINPDINVVKQCTGLVHPGDQIDVTATVTNPGDVALADVGVDDSEAGSLTLQSGDTNGNNLLDIDETWVFTGSYTAPAGTQSSNTVIAQGEDPLQSVWEDEDDCTTTIINPDIQVVKQCTSIVQPGELINVTADVTNPGDTPLSNVVASDDLAGSLTYVSGDTNGDTKLDTGETWTYTGSHIALDGDSVTDTVTAQGTDDLGMDVSDDDSCVTEIDHLPEVEVDKTVDGNDPDSDFSDDESTGVGSTVTYQVIIDNDSSETVTIMSVLDDTYPGIVCRDSNGDDVVGQTLAADDGDGPGSMNGGDDEITCTFQAQAPSTTDTAVTDVVTVQVRDKQENTTSDSDDATVRTLGTQVLGPTPTPTPSPTPVPSPTPTPKPVVAPRVLPSTGSGGVLAGNSFNLMLFAVIGLASIGGSVWVIWMNRRDSYS